GISGDEIARNVIHGFYSGVSTQEPDSITITDNDINHNTGQGVTVVAASGGVDIAGNTIDSNGASHGQNPYGIWLFEVNDASVSNNSLSNNVQVGIFLADSTDNTLIGNMVTGSKVGIRLQLNSNGNTLSDNAVEDNASGFNLFSSSGNTLTHNFAIGNAVDGFYLTNNSNDNTLNDNIAGYNTNGIHNVNSSGTVIDSNVIGVAVIGGMPIFGNSQDGILIDSGSDISITNNQILLNPTEGSGIHLGGGAGTGIVAHYNNISYNGPWGILNDSDNVIDATLNFWGSSAGPGVDGNNNANDYDLVTVAPFLASNSPQLVDGKIPGNLFTTVLQYNGTASSSTQITVYGDVVLSVASSSVDLPNLTTIISATSFNVASVSLGTPDLGTLSGLAGGNVVKGALQWGIPNLSFSFDPAITLHIWVGRDLDGQVLQIVRSPSGTGDWTTDGLVDTTCTVTDGVCTFHATKASTYVPCLGTCTTGGGSSHHETPTPTPTPPPSGGGVAYVPPMPSPTPTPTPTPTVCRRAENSLVRYQGDTKVYVIQNCIKHWIMTADDFNRFGYNWAAITVIPSSETYPDGSTVGTGTPAPTPTPSGTYIFTKFLSRGSRGEEVRQLQLKLKSLGFFPADIDATGVFGSTTTAAVKAFQKANSIAQLGFVGPATRAALNR
ncbi:MAG TPA: right-handed parallel beta-helix repeat-containing protein, partial [Candidatus Paceibacterota bacterium]|nr:right-handed parallel beta-helix repeat-containing protein [Candidatus Paceibacterota bacterium]